MHIAPTTPASLHRFLRFHYRGGRPGPIVRLLAAKEGTHTLGVLAVSMPTLNAPGRHALPVPDGDASCRSRTARAHWLNANLRTISRIIIDPRDRGRGVAAALIRAYLAETMTPHTEAFAAMGHLCPLFEAAGMTPIDTNPPPRDLRLIRALSEHNLPPEYLIDSTLTRALLLTRPAVVTAITRWANDSKATRHLLIDTRANFTLIAA
ncbi:MAG: hypothetical protein PSX37_12690, partial [bacterium]|nr:hypothetical protein [bacterium]